MLETHLVLAFFIIGALVGTLIQVYWIRVLMRDAGFYSEFYSVGPHRTHQKFKKDTVVRHTRNVLPFYIFLALVFIILWFMIGIFGLDLAYSLPFLLGLPEGLPIGYYLAEKNCI
ncbi:MAG: hypothetical protein JXB14_04835 [Candidatus Altiarchaeota archaeon]|nr:hypothetical protein [Candidatus Altiarchaeota archaeon]